MAVIGAAHGIKGELRVKTFTGDPLALGDYGPLFAKDGRRFDILDIRPQGTVVVARFKGVSDRNAAEALTGTELFVDRAALPAELDDEEFYHADLVGLSVVDEHGTEIGKVDGRAEFRRRRHSGAHAGPGLKGVLVPFTKAAVPEVDRRDADDPRSTRSLPGLSTTRTTTASRTRPSASAAASTRNGGRAARAMPEATGELSRHAC